MNKNNQLKIYFKIELEIQIQLKYNSFEIDSYNGI